MSGGTRGAEQGSLTIMVGGAEPAFRRVLPVLSLLGRRIYHLGPAGTGHAMKAINNFLLASALVAATEALAVAQAYGLEPARALEVLNASSGRSWVSEEKLPPLLAGTGATTFALGLLAKDVSIYRTMGEEAGQHAPVGHLVGRRLAEAVAEAGPHVDYTWLARRVLMPPPDPGEA